MTAREILIITCIPGVSIGGVTASLAGSDLLNDVRGLMPGDKKFYILMLKHFLPWNRFRFWQSIIREHRQLRPDSFLVPVFMVGLTLAFSSLLGLLMAFFILGL